MSCQNHYDITRDSVNTNKGMDAEQLLRPFASDVDVVRCDGCLDDLKLVFALLIYSCCLISLGKNRSRPVNQFSWEEASSRCLESSTSTVSYNFTKPYNPSPPNAVREYEA